MKYTSAGDSEGVRIGGMMHENKFSKSIEHGEVTYVDHGLEHLSCDDDGLPLAPAAVDDLLLGDGDDLRGHLHPEVTAAIVVTNSSEDTTTMSNRNYKVDTRRAREKVSRKRRREGNDKYNKKQKMKEKRQQTKEKKANKLKHQIVTALGCVPRAL